MTQAQQNKEQEIRQRFKKAKRRAIIKAALMALAGVALTVALAFIDVQWMMIGFAFFLIFAAFAARSVTEDFKRIRQAEKQQLDSLRDQSFGGFKIR